MTTPPSAETLTNLIDGLVNFQAETENMTFSQLIILLEIGKYPKGVPYDDIARTLNIPRNGIAATAKKYEELVSRVVRIDRRIIFKLTAQGNTLISRFANLSAEKQPDDTQQDPSEPLQES